MKGSGRSPSEEILAESPATSDLLSSRTPDPLDVEGWNLRRVQLQEALALGESPALHEALGQAGYWLGDEALTLQSRERAYHLYRTAGDKISAARLATLVANDYFLFRGAISVANGWFQHASRLLENQPVSPEHGWLSFHRADLRYFAFGDSGGALELATDADAIAQLLGVDALTILAQSLRGLTLVTLGRVDEGMALLDGSAVAAIVDFSKDVELLNSVTCNLLQACNLARDYERSSEWCERLVEYYRNRQQEYLFCFCRPSFAFALTRQGKWERADAELQAAIDEISVIRPAMLVETHIRLAELRYLQGEWEESAQLLHGAEADSLSLIGRATLELARGDNALAEQLAERYLRKIVPRLRLERMQPLELLLVAQVNQGNVQGAQETLMEIGEIAALIGTSPMRAAEAAARGRVLAGTGRARAAAAAFEDAVDYFQRSGTPYERARVKLELAHAQIALGKQREARTEMMDAVAILQALGARADAERAQRALDMLDEMLASSNDSHSQGQHSNLLTMRENEVLMLVAEGKSNQEIAALLVVSPRTVERHISTIYEKLNITGRSARAAATAWALRHTTDSTQD